MAASEAQAGYHGRQVSISPLGIILVFFVYIQPKSRFKISSLLRFKGEYRYVYSCLAAEGMRRVWCSARAEKVPYYQRHLNLRVISSIFEKGGLKFVFMESWLRDLKASSTFCRILKQVDGETSRVCVYAKL